jgi:plasmid stabilization system protein ParE
MEHTVALIGKFPNMGHLKYRQVVRMLPVRRYPQYLVFYAIQEDEVVILNVRHGARKRLWEDEG